MDKIVNVLGESYQLIQSDSTKDPCLNEADGYCDYTIKACVIGNIIQTDDTVKDLEGYRKKVIRHELIHAFLFESGLGSESWGGNEEIVDWIAYQFPKLLEAFKVADAL